MVAHQSPGVYLTEAPLTSPPEQLGAAVAVGMFVGAAPKGPIDTPTRLDSWSDYVTRFGGFDKIEGIDANVANAPTAVYVRATTTGTASNSTGGIVGAKKGDLAFVNAYRGTKGTFYKYVSGESAQPGFSLPHSIYVYDGAAWQDTGYRWNSQSKLFRDRADILGGPSPAVNIVFTATDPTVTAPVGITPAYGDIALRWDPGTSTFLAYTYGNANSTYFNGTGASEGSGTITVTATGGTFTLTVGGQTTSAVAYNATAATLLAALEALSNVAPGDLTVTKNSGNFIITATDTGAFADSVFPTTTVGTGSLTGGTATWAITTAGGAADAKGTYDPTHTAPDTLVALPVGWNAINFTAQKKVTPGIDFFLSSDAGATDFWGPFSDSTLGTDVNNPAKYASAIDLTDLTGFDTFEPEIPALDPNEPIVGVSYLPYSVYSFFQNGGRTCYVIRSIDHTRPGTIATLPYTGAASAQAFTVQAKGAGTWGNKVGVLITSQAVAGGAYSAYTLRVYLNQGTVSTPAWAEAERFTDLSMRSDIPGLRRFDVVVNDGTAGSQYVTLVNFTTNPDLTTPSSALTADGSNASVRPLGQGSGAVAGTDPGLPQAVDLQTSAVNNATRIEGPLLINVAGLTTDTEDYTAFRSALLNTSLFDADRDDLVIVNDGFAPRGGRDEGAYISAITSASDANTRVDSHTADFAPWVYIIDPAVVGGTILVPPGGVVTGVMSRVDASEGVFRAAAGTVAGTSAIGVETKFTKGQEGDLNNAQINVLKLVPGQGVCIMGARTRKFYGADRYLPVRRTLIFIESTLRRNCGFAVFENNDENLWGRLQLTADRVLRPLWEARGLKGDTAAEAYYVRCDATINTPAVVQSGEVRMEVGVALQTPAEFVIIRVSQFDGVITTSTEVQAQ